nr:hypothetical protein [Actinomycetales bacterium]
SQDLPEGSLAFTFCQVPVVYRHGDRLALVARRTDGPDVHCVAGVLDEGLSTSIFRRDGRVTALIVDSPDGVLAEARRPAATTTEWWRWLDPSLSDEAEARRFAPDMVTR